MISVNDLEQVAKARLEDSLVLTGYGRYDGSVYLCGYALEIALKVRICKLHGRSDFPETKAEFTNLEKWKTHNLKELLKLSGLETVIKTDPKYSSRYSHVLYNWGVDYRYKKLSADEVKACDMIEANEILLGVIL